MACLPMRPFIADLRFKKSGIGKLLAKRVKLFWIQKIRNADPWVRSGMLKFLGLSTQPAQDRRVNDFLLISGIFCHMSASCIYHATLLKMSI